MKKLILGAALILGTMFMAVDTAEAHSGYAPFSYTCNSNGDKWVLMRYQYHPWAGSPHFWTSSAYWAYAGSCNYYAW